MIAPSKHDDFVSPLSPGRQLIHRAAMGVLHEVIFVYATGVNASSADANPTARTRDRAQHVADDETTIHSTAFPQSDAVIASISERSISLSGLLTFESSAINSSVIGIEPVLTRRRFPCRDVKFDPQSVTYVSEHLLPMSPVYTPSP